MDLKYCEAYVSSLAERDPENAASLTRAIAAAYEGNPNAVAYLEKHIPSQSARWPLLQCPDFGLSDYGITPTRVDAIDVGLSAAFYNKTLRDGFTQAAYGNSFEARYVSIEDLVAHIQKGGAWTPGAFRSNRRVKANFVSAQILALDFDDGISAHDCAMDLKMNCYSALIYPTPSSTPDHPKTRVVFILSEPVTDLQEWEAMQRGLIAHYAHMRPDPACKDAARLFYGSDIGGGFECAIQSLPIELARHMAWELAQQEATQKELRQYTRRDTTAMSDMQTDAYLKKAYEDELMRLRSTPAGQRNNQLFRSACALFGFSKGGWDVPDSIVEQDMHEIGHALGLEQHEIEATVRSAYTTATARHKPMQG